MRSIPHSFKKAFQDLGEKDTSTHVPGDACWACGEPSPTEVCESCKADIALDLEQMDPNYWKDQRSSFGEDEALMKDYYTHDASVKLAFEDFGGGFDSGDPYDGDDLEALGQRESWEPSQSEMASEDESDFIFDPENPDEFEANMTAYDWHGGQWSPLYAYASSGSIEDKDALLGEISDCMNAVQGNPDKYPSDEMDRLQNLKAVVEAEPDVLDIHQGSVHSAATGKQLFELIKQLQEAANIPELKPYRAKIVQLTSMLNFSLQNTQNWDRDRPELNQLYNTIKAPLEAVLKGGDSSKFVMDVSRGVSTLTSASVKRTCSDFPTPGHLIASAGFKRKVAMKQEDFIEDVPKILGKPGADPDTMNYFDDRDMFRRFYSQLFESAVLIADDGTYYQVLQVVMTSGNFVAMMQDVLHPQIVFTISVNDLVAHTWKWITPFDVVVNPDLAPSTVNSISDIVSVADLDAPAIPKQWLSY